MTIRRLMNMMFALLGTLAVALMVLITYHAANRRILVQLQQQRFTSYQLADELRQSSDDLTRFARTYVATGDPKFEGYYRDVLAIRNGTQPRPADYQRIYWDFRVDRGSDPRPPGAPVALRELMTRAGFTAGELESLAQAQATSDSLVAIEEIAMHAVRGEYRDATGGFTRRGPPNQALAIRLMHDAAYHREKARIMAPIDSFMAAVESRTASELAGFHQRTGRMLGTIESILAVFAVIVLASYFVVRWKVLLPVRSLQEQTRLVAADLDRLAEISAHIAYGDLTQSFAVSTSPIGSTRPDEVGELSRLHDSMVARLQATGASIAAVTADLRAATDAAESATRAKGAFLAHMTHEIRTPLNAVLGYAQLLQADGALDTDQRRKVAAIYTSGDHLLGLLNGVLEMSRIEAGRLSVSVQAFDLHALLDGVQSMFTGLTSQRGLKFELNMAPDLVRGVRSDPGKVRQVLINLLGNALKFTDRGWMALRVSSQDVGQGKCQVIVSVEDTGPGIPSDDQENIFTAFTQAESGKEHSGTGLGLTISRNVARLLGGDLTVRSVVGQGSTFTFTFTATRVPDHELQDTRRPHGHRRLDPAETRRKALVVDDVPSNREVLEEALSRAGFETRGAASGEQALEVNRAWSPDLIMTDLHMPGMGGLAAVQRLRAEQTRAVIIVTTAGDGESTPAEVAVAGAAALLRKPYHENDLLDTISRAMGVTFVEVSAAGKGAAPVRLQGLDAFTRDIPPELIVELRDACRQARAPRLIQLADRVAEHSGAAANAIREMANGFKYRELLEALDGTGNDKS